VSITVPGEWEPHSLTIVAWPTRRVVWQDYIHQAYDEYTYLIRTVAESEPVLVVATPNDVPMVQERLAGSPAVHIMSFVIDDGWIRDNGPIFGNTPDGLVGIDFDFNSWGNRFGPSDGDRSVGEALCEKLGVLHRPVPWVLEGGAVTFNGEGLALAAAECVLNPSRNGMISASAAEAVITQNFGIRQLTWVPFGVLEDLKNTDGHVDNIAVFVGANKVLVQACDRANDNYDRLQANIAVLKDVRSTRGVPVELIECPWLPYMTMPDGTRQPAPYVNFALSNEALLLPSVAASSDDSAVRFFADVFPERRVVLVPAEALTFGGGGPHCVTMQVPSGVHWLAE
jgi:agmatine deiminase